MCPLSGPKGSPLDAKKPVYNATAGAAFVSDPTNISTGGLSTGIGMSGQNVIGLTAPVEIFREGFNDNQIPGTVPTFAAAPPPGVVTVNTVASARMYIGGGRSVITNGLSVPTPYTAGISILEAGNGGSRDAGAGPAFTGFQMKMVTATGTVANAGVVETGWVNRSGVTITTGQSIFGSDVAASAAPA
jgi:hypothetical protein